MASVQITAGVQYSISTPYHDGGYLQFPDQTTSVYATLGSYVEDISQQWIFEPSDTDGSAFAIANWEFKTYVSNTDSLLSSSADPQLWYLAPVNEGFYTICSDPDCSLAWAPRSEAGGESTDNEIVLAAPDSSDGAELWRIVPVESPTVSSRPIRTISSTQTSPPPSRTGGPADSEVDQHLSVLKNCAPCGNARCRFTQSGAPSSETYGILIGQPVANCGSKTTEATKTTLGGSFELQRSFGVQTTTGFSLGLIRAGPGLDFSATTTEGTEKKISQSQTIEVNIPPGQVGALVANVSYTTTPGRIAVDDRTLAFVSNEPENVLEFSVMYSDCNTRISVLPLPVSECTTSSAPTSRRMPVLALGVAFLCSVVTLL